MKQTVTESMFCREFENRRPENFTYAGLRALFEYLCQFEEDTGEELEFDCVGICCEYSEVTFEDNECPDEALKAAGHGYTLDELREQPTVIDVGELDSGTVRFASVIILQY